jgi:hypothetical protein
MMKTTIFLGDDDAVTFYTWTGRFRLEDTYVLTWENMTPRNVFRLLMAADSFPCQRKPIVTLNDVS